MKEYLRYNVESAQAEVCPRYNRSAAGWAARLGGSRGGPEGQFAVQGLGGSPKIPRGRFQGIGSSEAMDSSLVVAGSGGIGGPWRPGAKGRS